MKGVSIIIPCFNAEKWIGETLESVFRQDVADLEVIVVDDGSTDRSSDIVRGFPNVQLVRTRNGGPSAARNRGTTVARGEFIQFLDADDLLESGKLHAQVKVLADSGADVAYGDWRELRISAAGTNVEGRHVARRVVGDADIAVLSDFWCPPAAYLFRRAIVERVGGWDEQQSVIEDVRLVLTCALHGARFVYVPGLAASYRVHDSDSQSTRDPLAFTRGCLRNAQTAEDWWLQRSPLTDGQRTVLRDVYSQVARASFGRDNPTFEVAYAALKRLDPSYLPNGPWHFNLASRLVGYRSAEMLALHYRRAKRVLLRQ